MSGRPPITLRDLAAIDVGQLRGVGEKKRASLAAFDIHDVLDLVTTYPRRWVDRTNEARIADLVPGQEALVLVTVRSVTKRVTRNRRTMVNVNVGDGSGRMQVVFFNQPWRERQLKEGLQIALFGKADTYRGGLQMANPVVDLIGDRTGKIVPIYPQSEKAQLNTWELAAWVEEALRRCRERGIADPVPERVRDRLGLVDRASALWSIHGPDTMREKDAARRRLAFDELLRVQLVLVMRKRELERTSKGLEHVIGGELVQRFHDALPYPLTGAQQRAIGEIQADLAGPNPMHRLLQGDVGAGKTVVAVTTLLDAVQGGHQGALMAPTEVLAEQHAAGVRALLGDLEVPDPGNLFGDRPLRVELLTNRVTGSERKAVLAGLADGAVDIVIGTHALIQEGVEFNSLGAVVVDEQHRFGVEQRAALRDKSLAHVPDLLVMTATPIPRTAAMTVYGDLDVSVLDELPPGRTPIVTKWANGPLLEVEVWGDVRAQIAEGRQAYVVCPLIEESEKLEVASAEETYQRLAAGELAGLRLGLLHGRLTPAEKQMTMDLFRAGQLDVLVATTVIEVGVDVPNATVMVILDADRFGIAQLHQLRGRVGRGAHESTCWLVTQEHEGGNARVEALVASTDGFELAEVDLELRGEGTLMSTSQKGRSDLKLASLRRDRGLVARAREAAFEIVDADPDLAAHPVLLDELDLLFTEEDEGFLAKS
ncbi:MAG: ATP-dependent DNA helicase RecG [Ilumatobacter sp.]|uniref:ATP-dependent DNA helicase RecG n=1 Tax=Ilumatobacter sp. TaxID=1967498 RepID=UPI0026328929|nr:ATP-dependent DNA helicase RecG [Ilumatobacter sp.]MDJ0770753.1 ATP-dependent DNA helicase RecG [Ilumatobacter sp.]